MGPSEAWFVPLREKHELRTGPYEIIVAEHAPLWVSSGPTGVDEAAALPWHLSFCSLLDDSILDVGSELQEVFPEEVLGALELWR